jgi:hypothetical protein
VTARAKRLLGGALVALALSAMSVLAGSSLPKAWSHWRYLRPIELTATNQPRLVSIAIPPNVYPHSRSDLGDVRVIDNLGEEVPYARFMRLGSNNSVSIPTQVLENSFAPGHYTQVVLRTQKRVPFHDAVRIETNESDFMEWVEIAASDDAHAWRIVQPRAPIFRFRKEGRQGTQTVSYSENNARYLRIRVLDGKSKFPVTGATILYETSEPPERVPVDLNLTPDPNPPAHSTSWIVDAGRDAIPVSEVRFNVPEPTEFVRTVEFSTSGDRRNWSTWTTGEIYRYHQDANARGAAHERLTVSLPYELTTARYWRLAILNGNDPPLAGATPQFYTTPRHIVFEQQLGRSYTLIYGEYRAAAPQYDLERRLDSKQELSALTAAVGPEAENSNYSDPRPWTEQHTALLWIVVGLVALAIGFSAIRALKRTE